MESQKNSNHLQIKDEKGSKDNTESEESKQSNDDIEMEVIQRHSVFTEVSDAPSETVFDEPNWLHILDTYIWKFKICAILSLYAIEPFTHSVLAGFVYLIYIAFIFVILYFIYFKQLGKKYHNATCRMFVIGIFCTELYFSDRGFIKKWEDAVHDGMGNFFFAAISVFCIASSVAIGYYSWMATHSVSQTLHKIFGIYSTPFNVHFAESDEVITVNGEDIDNALTLNEFKNNSDALRDESIIAINGKYCHSPDELQHIWMEETDKDNPVLFTLSKSEDEGACLRNWTLLILWMFRLWFVVYLFGVLANYITDKALSIEGLAKDEGRKKTHYGDIYTFDSSKAAATLAFGASGFCQEACLFMVAATYFMMPEFKTIKQAPYIFIFWASFTFAFVENVHFFEQRYNAGVLFFRCIFGTASHVLFTCVASYALINGLNRDKNQSYDQLAMGIAIYCLAFGIGFCWHGLNDFWFYWNGIYDIHHNAPFVFVSVFIPASIFMAYVVMMSLTDIQKLFRTKRYFVWTAVGICVWFGLMLLLWIVIVP